MLTRPAHRWIATVGAITTLATAACGTGEDQPQTIVTKSPLRTFAPLVHLHSEEQSFPMSTARFLRHSTLEWAGGPCPFEVNVAAGFESRRQTGEGAPPLSERRLGGRPAYRHRPMRTGCRTPRSAVYATNQPTRPFGDGTRPPGLHPSEGFTLDLLRDAHDGERRLERRDGQAFLAGVPAYARMSATSGGQRLTYWLLFGKSDSIGRDRQETITAHEGDWVRIDVGVRRTGADRYVPLSVTYHRPGGRPETVDWADVERTATHPVVFSARGSHVPYPKPGRHERRARSSYDGGWQIAIDDAAHCADCPRWPTWKHLRHVEQERWYGYRGGWGTRGPTGESSGPEGPQPPDTRS